MSMYVEILSQAIATTEVAPAAREALIKDVVERRAQMLESRALHEGSAETRIAREVAYDGALIALCAELGIDIAPTRFANPREERTRLERELSLAGVELER
ncbi:MAG TPA: hypothetical protein VNG12_00425 [Acidimicrobiales bacterium]|nr:hypothetical protein [Acidimicrobiales bacterium]